MIMKTKGVVMKHLKLKITLGLIVAVAVIIYICVSANKVLAVGVVIAIAVVIFALYKFLKYMFSAYFKGTKVSYFKTLFNKEKSLRYSTFKKINKMVPGAKFVMCDVYMPKVDGTTAKADMILFNETGVYVVDIKPYSGRIAGAEQGREWTYTKNGKTENIPNPMVWNRLYVNWLKSYIAKEAPNAKFFSYVVYSTGCKIKDITYKTYTGTVATAATLTNEMKANIAKTGIGTSMSGSELDFALEKVKMLKDESYAKSITDIQGIQETIFYEMKKEVNEYDYKNPDLE